MIEVVHTDAALLVLSKPSGLLAVPGRGQDKQDCLSARVRARYPDALVVHRLDMATSGLMVMARGIAVQRILSQSFARREVLKRYEALVHGVLETPPETENGWSSIDLPLLSDWPNRPLQKVDPLHGKPSLTRWRILGHEDGATRVELEPVTGRSHQLRVHLAALGYPVLGDPLYGHEVAKSRAGRLLLHARTLGFFHPVSGEWLEFESPVPF
ncbi:RluA family pseudouridine synthase [Methylococcus capsulatus]|jgi:tRNA pseudouridine32 synthase/23S rRNA pseudouridine746 synthase|uniref:Ribosomal large subunit pseudouridine synthase A n=1 Tax=Methylococcus capsulatus (strain ATCC 33009 / NCIMB 11132 / Bath) TaxID=243233 RepID=Q608A5_METCA|nr:RluA family pseudouridine synthase [Methylococcus capsulatus]AAU92120.1 ribosomal large subunit pseudouridine synthase A [Methylococcus capsulatus str. Bath]QXP92528.1 RluA family pseudouridine synthase [Methylococcus capsulatus]UQN12747.1 RluA family pseudouridine synthase [Methylococcus capsulatus]